MIPLVANSHPAIAALCRRFGVVRLDLFGSAATGAFAETRSDLDFVVTFSHPTPTVDYADRYLDFAGELESLLGRRVDVVSAHALRQSRLAHAIASSREPVYGESVPVTV